MIPHARSYYNGSLKALVIRSTDGDVWYSYDTPVAYRVDGQPVRVSVNAFSCTTGKHLNAIDGGGRKAKAERIPRDTFLAELSEAFRWS